MPSYLNFPTSQSTGVRPDVARGRPLLLPAVADREPAADVLPRLPALPAQRPEVLLGGGGGQRGARRHPTHQAQRPLLRFVFKETLIDCNKSISSALIIPLTLFIQANLPSTSSTPTGTLPSSAPGRTPLPNWSPRSTWCGCRRPNTSSSWRPPPQ